MRKTKVLSSGALLGGFIGCLVGYFSPTAKNFAAIIPMYAVLFALLGTLASSVYWMITRTESERAEGKIRTEEEQKRNAAAAKGSPSILGGAAMMLAAMAWFFAGLVGGVIFFYPPILFLIGLVAFIRGILSGGTPKQNAVQNPSDSQSV